VGPGLGAGIVTGRPGLGTDDPRFSMRLLFDLMDALARHGYPPRNSWTTDQIMELRVAMLRVLYMGSNPPGLVEFDQ
jgi:hypothetical protein